jgi:hypothetical protein
LEEGGLATLGLSIFENTYRLSFKGIKQETFGFGLSVFDRFRILGFKDRSIRNQEFRKRHKGTCQWSCLDKDLDLDLENGHLGLGNIKNVTGRKLLEFYFIILHFENPYTLLFLVKALVNLLIKVNYKFYSTPSDSGLVIISCESGTLLH